MIKVNDIISVVDIKTNKIIKSGIVKHVKYCNTLNEIDSEYKFKLIERTYFSYDFRYFFHEFSDKYKVYHSENHEVNESIPSDYVIDMWKPERRNLKNSEDFYKIDIFREFDINELDEEIKELVHLLNNYDILTTSSCSGHGKYKPYIVIRKTNIVKMLNFIVDKVNEISTVKVILNENCREFYSYYDNTNNINTLIKLEIDYIGDDYVVIIKKITEIIRKYLVLFE